jgi:ATP-dependent DNA ligase
VFLDAFRDGDDKSVGWPARKQVINRSYEGYVAKDEASAYEGGATKRWLKVKVPGWTDSDD